MPSHTSYTPLETLKLCQSIVQYGDDDEAFTITAKQLNNLEVIRESGSYDAQRLSADALKDLYNNLLRLEKSESRKINGDGAVDANASRKRKASASPGPDGAEEELLQGLVDKLYARFREDTIRSIRQDEEQYFRLQQEVEELERVEAAGAAQHAQALPSQPTAHQVQPKQNAGDGSLMNTPQQQTARVLSPATRNSQPPDAPQKTASPMPQPLPQGQAYAMNMPTPVSGRPNGPQAPIISQAGFPVIPQGQPRPPYENRMPPPTDYGGRKGSSATSTPARGSPVPQPPQQYPQYPQYAPPPPQWPQQYPPQQQYGPPMGYPPQGYYGQPHPPRQQAPYQQPYSPYAQPSPMQYPPPLHGWHPSPSHSPYAQAPPGYSTPGHPTPQRPLSRTPGSSTPWKHRPLMPQNSRPSSPTRPDRSVSPMSEHEPDEASRQGSVKPIKKAATPKREGKPARRGRPPSVAASRRSQSVASQTPEAAASEVGFKPSAIKDEAPNTPQPSAADREPRSSGRKGRPRSSASTSTLQPDTVRPGTTNKRKRSSPPPEFATPPPENPARETRSSLHSSDPSLVLVSKNFAKPAQLVLNEIGSHKLGGVFAKPLSERDAPGYKDLILRPQDLKSIRSAVSKGARAAVAAIDILEVPEEENPETAEEFSKDADGQGAVGNGFYMIKKTEELEPPKGIVNASQLEMELMRVFANAIMFNPMPRNERGFGRNLRLRKRGGDVLSVERDEMSDGDGDDTLAAEESALSEDFDSAEGTGIIADAREMFEDVRKQIDAWRDLENERRKLDHHDQSGSVVSANTGDDANTTGNTPVASKEKDLAPAEEGRGTLRKRRKLVAD